MQLCWSKIVNRTKERVCLRILEKTIEAKYHSFCNENPECSIKLRKFGELHLRNVRLRKMAQRAVCCCTIHVNVDYFRKAAKRYCQSIGQSPCKAKSLTWLKNLKCSSKCYVENRSCAGSCYQF